jgi:hypothetical protein
MALLGSNSAAAVAGCWEAQSLNPRSHVKGTIRMTKLPLSAILLALVLMGCRSSMDTAAAAYLAMEAETDVTRDAIAAEFKVWSDPNRYGPAYAHSIAWREDFIRRLDGLQFPDEVRGQVTTLRAAEVALIDVERTLAASETVPHFFGPGNPAYPAAAWARAEMRRVLGLPPRVLQFLPPQESFGPAD